MCFRWSYPTNWQKRSKSHCTMISMRLTSALLLAPEHAGRIMSVLCGSPACRAGERQSMRLLGWCVTVGLSVVAVLSRLLQRWLRPSERNVRKLRGVPAASSVRPLASASGRAIEQSVLVGQCAVRRRHSLGRVLPNPTVNRTCAIMPAQSGYLARWSSQHSASL